MRTLRQDLKGPFPSRRAPSFIALTFWGVVDIADDEAPASRIADGVIHDIKNPIFINHCTDVQS